ncbi:MAG: asparagine synthase (glutamine-hydrolyzing) [Candidatus Rhabdochlamydia sp.]
MCGITGIISFSLTPDELIQGIEQSCQALHLRGPDQRGCIIHAPAAFGVARLAIRDPLKGAQPMEREGYVITFNGELYQTETLKALILSQGHTLHTTSDTELLLLGFITLGPLIFNSLSGMFACSIWDKSSQTLYLARDPFGEKPLYYTQGSGFFAFASEIKAFTPWSCINWEIKPSDLHDFLTHSYLSHEATGWEAICKLKPGYFLTYHEGKLSQQAYYTPVVQEEIENTAFTSGQLLSLLQTSVIGCLVSDKPVGAFLSGGLDSTTVTALLCQQIPSAPIFSLHWDHPAYSEEVYTTAVASSLRLNHFSTRCDPSYVINYFETIVSRYDEPFADESMIPTYCLSQFAKQHVDVVLTGDGADELFHGYERYHFNEDFTTYVNTFCALSPDVHADICHPDFLALKPVPPLILLPQTLTEKRGRSYLDLLNYLPCDILTKVDRASMGVGLEARAPFLSRTVAEFALKCKSDALFNLEGEGKQILRSAVKSLVPPLITQRKKMGFGMPLKEWFCHSLKEWMMSRLLEGSLYQQGWFSRHKIASLITSHLNQDRNHARALFNLLVLEEWIRNRPRYQVRSFGLP